MSARPEFVRVIDIDGRGHVVLRTAILQVAPVTRVDGYSFSPGAVVRLQDGGAIPVYEHERAALEAALLRDAVQQEETP